MDLIRWGATRRIHTIVNLPFSLHTPPYDSIASPFTASCASLMYITLLHLRTHHRESGCPISQSTIHYITTNSLTVSVPHLAHQPTIHQSILLHSTIVRSCTNRQTWGTLYPSPELVRHHRAVRRNWKRTTILHPPLQLHYHRFPRQLFEKRFRAHHCRRRLQTISPNQYTWIKQQTLRIRAHFLYHFKATLAPCLAQHSQVGGLGAIAQLMSQYDGEQFVPVQLEINICPALEACFLCTNENESKIMFSNYNTRGDRRFAPHLACLPMFPP